MFPMYPFFCGGEMFPGTNFHNLDLDWIIKVIVDFQKQYTELEQTIAEGKTSIETTTQEKLAQLNTEATRILNQLQNAYNSYDSQINADVVTALNQFQIRAQEIVNHTAQTIPQDYSELSASVLTLSTASAFTTKMVNLEEQYNIIPLTFTNAGGISSGVPYDSTPPSHRFRTITAYPFPKGSFILIPDNLVSNFAIWCNMYWDAGRYWGSFFGDPEKRLDTFTSNSFAGQTENFYIAISGKTIADGNITDAMISELNNTIKIAIPKIQTNDERLSGNVTGAENLIKNIPFEFNRATYFYETWNNIVKEVADDYRIWDINNTDIDYNLPAGTYNIQFQFISNDGNNPSAVAFKIFNNAGVALVDYGSRTNDNFNRPFNFTLNSETTIHIQWKTYIGVKMAIYLFSDNYMTLKMASNAINSLEAYTGDDKYISIYTDPIQNAIRKYNATIEANNIGYLWISDLHINSLYPNRSKSLKRQLMACADLANRTNIKYIFIGGDILDREITYNAIYDLINELFTGIKYSRRPTFVILGNHDDNPYTNNVPLSKSKTNALFIGMNNGIANYPSMNSAYYTIDDGDYKLICLDSIDYPEGYNGANWWSYSQTQVTWLANTLLNTNKKIIMLSHMTYDYSHQCYNLGNEGNFTQDVINLMEAYNNHGTISLYGNTYNFNNNTGRILYWHAGHQHFDEQYTPDNRTIPILITSCAKNQDSTDALIQVEGNTYTTNTEFPWNSFGWYCKFWTNRTLETINEACIDIVSVGNTSVNVIRLGAGEDRQFNI